MSSSAAPTELPDAVVNAIRRASRAFESLQSSRYPTNGIGSSSSPAAAANEVSSKHALVMRTKTHAPDDDHPVLDAAGSAPSRWSEIYRSAVAEVPDEPSQRLWGLVSVVLSVLELGGTADDVNASAEIVAWGDRSSTALNDVDELLSTLHAAHPQQMSDDAVEELGPVVLGRFEEAFLTGHFDVAATLLDALLVFARRGRPRLLSADVEASLADVKRLLATGFHDHDSYARYWVPSANSLLVEWRADLYDVMVANDNTSIEDMRGVNQLVWDLCATCKDVLLLITQDAELLVERCLKSRRSAADFLVATCAVMEPYAALSHVSAIFAQYVGRWTAEAPEEEWWNTSALAVLEAATLHDVVGAMATVANSVNESDDHTSGVHAAAAPSVGQLNGGADGDASDVDGDSNDDDSVLSDTVSLSELVEHAPPISPAFARRFTVACMTAHVADLCAPVGIAASAADIHLTFTRNDLVAAYASLFAAHARTWRAAGLYACYSPLINPRFVADVVQGMTPLAATDDITYRSLKAFLRTSWCPHSALQTAVRAKLEAVLPGNATVARWWAAVEVYHSESACTLHRYVINTWWNSGSWGRAAWLAVEMGMTDTLQSHLRQMLCDAGALGNRQLYAVGLAVQHQLVGFDTSRAPELTRYLCAAAAVAMYRQGATAVQAAHRALAHTAAPGADTPTAAEVLRAEVACVEAVQTALTCADACEAMLHPITTFKLVEHGAELLLSLRQRMCDPTTGDTTASMDVSSTVLPLLVEAYQLSSIHFALSDASFSARTHALATKLARLHQTAL